MFCWCAFSSPMAACREKAAAFRLARRRLTVGKTSHRAIFAWRAAARWNRPGHPGLMRPQFLPLPGAAVADRRALPGAAVSDRRARLLGSPNRQMREYASLLQRPSAFPRLAPRASRATMPNHGLRTLSLERRSLTVEIEACGSQTRIRKPGGLRHGAAVSDRRARLLGSPNRQMREYASLLQRPSAFPRLTPRASRATMRNHRARTLSPGAAVSDRRARLLGSPKRKLRESASLFPRPSAFPRLTPRASRATMPNHGARTPVPGAAVSDRRARLLGSPNRQMRESASLLQRPSAFPRLAPRASRATMPNHGARPLSLERRSLTVVPVCWEARIVR